MINALISELENESKATAGVLEVLPESKFSWQPHQKSMSAGSLARHIATIPGQMLELLSTESFDTGDMNPQFSSCATTEELMSLFQSNLSQSISTMKSWDTAFLNQEWKLTRGSETIFALPRIAAIRGFQLNHLYHHRGQLTVYLRMLEIPVPSVYGPTADVNPFA
ncbi:DinB family protein [Oligoflexia bacterium]|nr:DinB family protein [Oligoflexia bacterium]